MPIELDMRRKYYGTQEAAAQLGISESKVRRLLVKGSIKGLKLGKTWLIPKIAYTGKGERTNGKH